MKVYENGVEIGALQMENEGLYTRITCKVEPSEALRRVYLAYPYGSQYLGLADRSGAFETKIARKNIPMHSCAVATCEPKGEYLPWCGQIDDVYVAAAWINDRELLLPQHEAMEFPAWDLETKIRNDKKWASVPLGANGMPQPREREARKNETMDFDDIDHSLPADLPADDDAGGQGWEADRTDL